MKKVLIIEDNRDISGLVALHLQDIDAKAEVASDGATGLRMAQDNQYDLIVLDLMLPELDGIEICRRLRTKDQFTPVLMLTAKGSELDRVLGLEMGADDYLPKPFSIREFLARVKAIFRRNELLKSSSVPREQEDLTPIQFGALSIDKTKREAKVDDKLVDLTVKEFDLLVHFLRYPGRVFTRAQLLDQVWGHGHHGFEHTVNSHINRLRYKIEENPANPRYILTVWGVGYKFVERID